MGDIGSHAKISHHVITQLMKVVPQSSIPEDDYTYLELGNFLTDASQFADPPAFHEARELAREKVLKKVGAGLLGANKWANTMFGRRSEGARHGLLPEMLRLLMYSFTHQVFDPDGLWSNAPHLAQQLQLAHPIDPTEVDRVLSVWYTQYFPHEHVDFPRFPEEQRQRHTSYRSELLDAYLFKTSRSGLITYLELHLLYLSEELSKLEVDWAQARAGGISQRQRRDFLVRLGHLLHAVEDYFFHSNFAELRQWQFLRRQRQLRDADPATPAGLTRLVENGLLGTGLATASIRLRRLLFRRLRYPIWTEEGLSRSGSDDGTALVFTGGFERTDVRHTLGGSLEAVERQLNQLKRFHLLAPEDDPRNSSLVLLRLLFSESERVSMNAGDKERVEERVERLRDKHRDQLAADAYPPAISELLNRGKLSHQAARWLKQAFEMDKVQEKNFGLFPGPGGVLIDFLSQIQAERDASRANSKQLDDDPKATMVLASANGASAEDVGSHSLLAKDSSDKDPFRADAVALAAHASAGVACALARRLEMNVGLNEGVDWDVVLRFFVRQPKHRSGRWEEEIIVSLRTTGPGFRQPDVNTLADQPRFPLLGPRNSPEKLLKRRNGEATKKLEDYYKQFETNPK